MCVTDGILCLSFFFFCPIGRNGGKRKKESDSQPNKSSSAEVKVGALGKYTHLCVCEKERALV